MHLSPIKTSEANDSFLWNFFLQTSHHKRKLQLYTFRFHATSNISMAAKDIYGMSGTLAPLMSLEIS
jgi:hypothetical protein